MYENLTGVKDMACKPDLALGVTLGSGVNLHAVRWTGSMYQWPYMQGPGSLLHLTPSPASLRHALYVAPIPAHPEHSWYVASAQLAWDVHCTWCPFQPASDECCMHCCS